MCGIGCYDDIEQADAFAAVRDDHLVPGRGGIAWEPVISALQEVGFDGMFTLELRDYTTGEDAPYGSFDEILAECGGMLDRLFGGSR